MKKYEKYLLACINLYGVLKMDDFKEIYYHYENEEVDDLLLLDTLKHLSNIDRYGLHFNDNLITSGFYEINDDENDLNEALELLNHLKDIPFNLLEKVEFLKYQDDFYSEERDSLNDLLNFTINNNISNKPYDYLYEIFDDYIWEKLLVSSHEQFMLDLKKIGFKYNSEFIENEFERLLLNSFKDKRFFLFKGHTYKDYTNKYHMFQNVDERVLRLLLSTTNLYGFISIDDFKYLSNYYLNETLSDDYIRGLISFINNDDSIPLNGNDNYIAGIFVSLDESDEINTLNNKRKKHSIYLPKKENIYKYISPSYIDNKTYINKLIDYLYKNKLTNSKKKDLESYTYMFIEMSRLGFDETSIEYYFNLIKLKDVSDNELEHIVLHLLDTLNNIRLFELYGNTFNEIDNIENTFIQ